MGTKLFDQYSFLHFSVGVVAYFLGLNFYVWALIHLIFEIVENSEIGMALINNISFWPGGKPYADSIINSLGDNISAWLGWFAAYCVDKLGQKLGWYQSHL